MLTCTIVYIPTARPFERFHSRQRYETYQITALQSILAILTCWEKDFKAGSTAVSNKGGRQGTVSSQGFTLGCLTMYKTIQTLTDGGSIEKCTVSRKVIGLLDTF